jgi:hypothetical protein
MEHVMQMLTLQAEYADLLKMEAGARPRPLEDVAADYAAALSRSMEFCAPMPSMD